MARRCAITGKGVLAGNNVSHSNKRTRRRFLPNLQVNSLMSDSLGESIQVRISANGLRTIEHKGGLDAYLLDTPADKLSLKLRRLKKRVVAKQVSAA